MRLLRKTQRKERGFWGFGNNPREKEQDWTCPRQPSAQPSSRHEALLKWMLRKKKLGILVLRVGFQLNSYHATVWRTFYAYSMALRSFSIFVASPTLVIVRQPKVNTLSNRESSTNTNSKQSENYVLCNPQNAKAQQPSTNWKVQTAIQSMNLHIANARRNLNFKRPLHTTYYINTLNPTPYIPIYPMYPAYPIYPEP